MSTVKKIVAALTAGKTEAPRRVEALKHLVVR